MLVDIMATIVDIIGSNRKAARPGLPMNFISRVSATILSGVDKTVSQIENHDAVVEASLKESQRAAAQARVRLQRVKRDGDLLLEKQKSLSQKIQHWSDRAKANHASDRQLALQCIARRKQCISEERELQAALKRHAEVEQQMVDTITSIEKRVATMSRQRNQMRSRQSAAEALRVINKVEGSNTNGIDDTFERWDLSISETEIHAGVSSTFNDADPLDAQFNAAEAQQELEDELNEFIANGQKNDQKHDQGADEQ